MVVPSQIEYIILTHDVLNYNKMRKTEISSKSLANEQLPDILIKKMSSLSLSNLKKSTSQNISNRNSIIHDNKENKENEAMNSNISSFQPDYSFLSTNLNSFSDLKIKPNKQLNLERLGKIKNKAFLKDLFNLFEKRIEELEL
jgi:hypothetical protein